MSTILTEFFKTPSPPPVVEGWASYLDYNILGASGMGHVEPLKTKIDLDDILAILHEETEKLDPPIVIHASNPEHQKLRTTGEMEALRDRTIRVGIPNIDLPDFLRDKLEEAKKSDFPVHALAAEDEPVVVGPGGVEPPANPYAVGLAMFKHYEEKVREEFPGLDDRAVQQKVLERASQHVVPKKDATDPANYEGFPARYPHWKWDTQYEELQTPPEKLPRIIDIIHTKNLEITYCLGGPHGTGKTAALKGILSDVPGAKVIDPQSGLEVTDGDVPTIVDPLFVKAMDEHEKIAETMKNHDDIAKFDGAFEEMLEFTRELINQSSIPDWKQFKADRAKEAAPDRLFVIKSPPAYMYFSRRGLMKRDGHKCRFCGKQFDPKSAEGVTPAGADLSQPVICHLLCKSRGGTTGFANCVTACVACVSKKGGKTPEEAGMELLPPAVPGQAVKHKGNEVWLTDLVGRVNYKPLPRNEFYNDPGPAQEFLRELIGDPKNRVAKNEVTIEDDDAQPVVVDAKPKE